MIKKISYALFAVAIASGVALSQDAAPAAATKVGESAASTYPSPSTVYLDPVRPKYGLMIGSVLKP